MERGEVFRIKRRYPVSGWGFLGFLFVWAGGFTLSTVGRGPYPNVDDLPFVYLMTGTLFVLWSTYFHRVTTSIELFGGYFIVKKFGRKPVQHPYAAILSYNERLDAGRGDPFTELTVYLTDNWLSIRSNEFRAYPYLSDHLTQYGQSVPHREVLTLAERNRLRWHIGGLALLIGATIAFGFIAHNPADPTSARMVSITGTVNCIREDKHKSRLKGVTIGLRAFPGFAFYVSRRQYDVRLETLASTLVPDDPVTLLIRQSDLDKKLRKTEPLTIGDKYVDYHQILVFGVNQGDSVDILASNPVFEPTHTNPLLRTILLSFLLLLCWTVWVYVDRQQVLRPG